MSLCPTNDATRAIILTIILPLFFCILHITESAEDLQKIRPDACVYGWHVLPFLFVCSSGDLKLIFSSS